MRKNKMLGVRKSGGVVAGSNVYIFAGKFRDRVEACSISEPQWEPVPADTVSEEEYSEWEDRNPTHKLRESFDAHLDEDFIETVELDLKYLSGIGICEHDILQVKERVEDSNFFVLVYEDALGGFELRSQPSSTSELSYCGVYECNI